MMQRKIIKTFAATIFLLDVALLWGNPVQTAHPPLVQRSIFGQAPYLIVWIFAAVEALSLIIMLRRQGFRIMRMFFAWLPVTWITFWLPFISARFVPDIPAILKLIIGEMIVIYLESILLYIITLGSFFYRERTGPPIPLQAIKLSVIMNIISILTFVLLLLVVTAGEGFSFSLV